MSKNKFIIIIAILLGAATIFVISNNKNGTIRPELMNFAVEDTAAISKIFLSDRNGGQITLERKSQSEWSLNKTMRPRKDVLKSLLEVIKRIDVRTRVASAAYNNVIKTLASSAIKCEIYLHGEDKPSRVYYVGGQTQDALGTFMMLEGSSVPFVTEIPGFNGYLTPRYSTGIDGWKENTLFRYSPGEIKSVSILYKNIPPNSFILTEDNGIYSVKNLFTNQTITRIDSVSAGNYFDMLQLVYYESHDHLYSLQQRDSLLSTVPAAIFDIIDNSGKKAEVNIYPYPVTESSLTRTDTTGVNLKYDIDRLFAYIVTTKELVTIQHYSFDQILRKFSDFDPNSKKKESAVKH